MIDLTKLEGFEWDRGNITKNKEKHNVGKQECEEIFFNKPFFIFDDDVHSGEEKRYGALGITNKQRRLSLFFTIRKNKIRVISARAQGKKDRTIYANEEQKLLKKAG